MNRHTNYLECQRYMNKQVQITTRQGMYEGTIVRLDQDKVYLQVNSGNRDKNKAYTSWFFAPFIIPLVLFDLLAIVLLDGRRRPFHNERRRFFY
ncbi:hypothetical protein E0485_22850 [Paenibacillus albiflavus]|uniref:DUF2642 domain-containing protein n=2 Tax=Paenibacillus albiflavus TaxID=2545760 RepID=A0A4R4E3Z2_9BACL|nr:hypothetical protein E0485_22850 [Paenibacillus albiflavus]